MKCTPCGHEIAEGTGYWAAFQDRNAFRIEMGCEHHKPEGLESAIATFGSGGCLMFWVGEWLHSLGMCDHQEPS